MIKGKAILKFGTGSIRVTPLCNNQGTDEHLAAICFNNATPGEINRSIPVESQDFSKQASVVMTFDKVESIDVVINALQWAKDALNDVLPETEKVGWDKPFDLNILEEKEEMKKELLTEQTKRYAKTILAAPNAKKVEIYTFSSKDEAEFRSEKLKKWPYKVIVKARDAHGRFAKGYALICCK